MIGRGFCPSDQSSVEQLSETARFAMPLRALELAGVKGAQPPWGAAFRVLIVVRDLVVSSVGAAPSVLGAYDCPTLWGNISLRPTTHAVW